MANDGERLPEETWADTRAIPRSLFGTPLCANPNDLHAQVAFLGVPYDWGSPGAPGSRYGPDGLRDTQIYFYAGRDGKGEAVGYYDFDADRQRLAGVSMADCGNVTIMAADIERNLWRMTRAVRTIVERGALPVVIGGDHSITAALVRGFDAYPELDIVQFDAHHDFSAGAQGVSWSSGTPIRRCAEFSWVRNISHIGLRSMLSSREGFEAARTRGNRIIMADRFREIGPQAAMELVPESDAMYVTIDVDAMDPSICPGNGSPEPGGLTYLEMRDALRALARRGRIAGIDVVEVSPRLDPAGMTSRIAAHLIVDFLTAIFDEEQSRSTASPPARAQVASSRPAPSRTR